MFMFKFGCDTLSEGCPIFRLQNVVRRVTATWRTIPTSLIPKVFAYNLFF